MKSRSILLIILGVVLALFGLLRLTVPGNNLLITLALGVIGAAMIVLGRFLDREKAALKEVTREDRWERTLQCIRCESERHDVLNNRGEVTSTRYSYPPGGRYSITPPSHTPAYCREMAGHDWHPSSVRKLEEPATPSGDDG